MSNPAVRSAFFIRGKDIPKIYNVVYDKSNPLQAMSMSRLDTKYLLTRLQGRLQYGDKTVAQRIGVLKNKLQGLDKKINKLRKPVIARLPGTTGNSEVSQAYEYLASAITYTDLYNTLVRGYQPVLSRKMISELKHCVVATKHFTQDHFDQINPHKLALLAWRILQSGECPDWAIAGLIICIDRAPVRTKRPLIHHDPTIMGNSWLVEAFNNRHNFSYPKEIINSAKAIDTDLSKMKMFLHDIELVPRRLNVIVGLHHVKKNNSFPLAGLEGYCKAMYDWGFISQIPAFILNIAKLHNRKRIPRGALYIGIKAACKSNSFDVAVQLVNYLRVMEDIKSDEIVPLPADVAWSYAIALNRISMNKKKHYCISDTDESYVMLQHAANRTTQDTIKPLLSGNLASIFNDVTNNDVLQQNPKDLEKLDSMSDEDFSKLFDMSKISNVVCDISEYLDENQIFFGILHAMVGLSSESIRRDAKVQQPLIVKVATVERMARHYSERRTMFKPREVVNDAADVDTTSTLTQEELNNAVNEFLTLPVETLDKKTDLDNLIKILDKIEAKPDTDSDFANPLLDKKTYDDVYSDLPESIKGDKLINEVHDLYSMRLGLGTLINPNKAEPVTLEVVRAMMVQLNLTYEIDVENGLMFVHPEGINQFTTEIRKIRRYNEESEKQRVAILSANGGML